MDNIDEMVSTLQAKDPIFQQLFNDACSEFINLQPDEKDKATKIFKETFPSYEFSLSMFQHQWIIRRAETQLNAETGIETVCNKDIFDAASRKYLKQPQVLPAQRRRRQEKFNLGEFLRQKRADGEYYQLNLQDRDLVEDLMDDLNDDKARNDQKADIALNKMVQMAAIFNGSLPYRLIELHPERRIH